MTAPRPEICACLFAHEMMRRLGILPAEIFLDLRIADFYGIVVEKAGKTWTWTLGRLPIDAASFQREWEEGTRYWNSSSDDEIAALGFHRSPQVALGALVIQSLIEKGIPLDPVGAVAAVEQRWKAAN